jgi:U3 small nucleolar RNA-associated protein 20
VCRATLPDKGFTAHVIGYTLHAVLDAVVGHLLTKKGAKQAAAEAAAAAGKEGDGEDAAGGGGTQEDEEDEWAAGDAAGTGAEQGPLGELEASMDVAGSCDRG